MAKSKEPKNKARYYELMESNHTQWEYGVTTEDGAKVERTYKKGDKFWSDQDLLKFNGPNLSPKFRIIGEDEGRPPEPKRETVQPEAAPVPRKGRSDAEMAELNAMTQKEIQDYAKNHNLDLSGAKTKDEMLKKLREG